MFIFGEKAASVPPGHPGGENLWAVAFRVIVDEKRSIFAPFGAVCNNTRNIYFMLDVDGDIKCHEE